jgi:hypothetical protein
MNRLYKLMIAGAMATALFTGCDKNENIGNVIVPPSQATFANQTGGSYFVENTPTSTFKVPVGVTTLSNVARKVNFTVTSPTGAGAAQYTIVGGNSVTIPAGKAVDSITVRGLFAGFPGTRRDTLIFKISGGDVDPGKFNDTYTLVMTKFCPVNLSAFTGNYTRSFDLQPPSTPYGPYAISVSSVTSLTPTTGFVLMNNVWDVGSANIRVNLDWTNPANFTTSVPTQFLYNDPTFGPATIRPVGTGTFSSCDNTFSLRYEVTVAAGTFGVFTTTIAR